MGLQEGMASRQGQAVLHDIICLANNPEGEVALLIIGIDEGAGYAVYDLDQHPDNRMNTQQLNDMLHKVRWADAVPPVRVVTAFLKDGRVDTIIIELGDEGVPYRLNADYTFAEKRDGKIIGKTVVRAGTIYSREQDGNVPIDSTASPLATERLWRRHFGLDKTPLERLPSLLKEPEKWQHTWPVIPRDDEGGGYSYYHEDFWRERCNHPRDTGSLHLSCTNLSSFFLKKCPSRKGEGHFTCGFVFLCRAVSVGLI